MKSTAVTILLLAVCTLAFFLWGFYEHIQLLNTENLELENNYCRIQLDNLCQLSNKFREIAPQEAQDSVPALNCTRIALK